MLALRACAEEDKDGWSCLLQDIRTRGATQMDLIVTDGHEGLLAAVSALFTATPRQRCVVHKQPSAAERHSPSRAQGDQRRTLWDLQTGDKRACAPQFGRESAPNTRSVILKRSAVSGKTKSICSPYIAFPPVMHRYIRSINAIESL